ncbi:GATA transcription factor 4-like isoform X2 [Silene latifolia]|uniref:GATA transcription factor 4-like isoform X2 n=1 Tax=Silene latifolia TaxID=37657 RepID=UPI003D76ACFB
MGGGNGIVKDQLLNFNNIHQIQPPQFQHQQQQLNNNSQHDVAEDKDKDPFFLSLPIHPAEEAAELEWLSHFVDDSFSPYSTPFPSGYAPKPEPETVNHEREPERKRARRVWATDSSPPPNNPVRKGSHKINCKKTCSHCGTQKTPQWRGGPNGPKTLCNACGVQYKKGRLWPEYRPASSPSYSRELHSSSHRKVMEMRMVKNKEETGP